MTDDLNRRRFVKGSVVASAAAALGLGAGDAPAGDQAGAPAPLPAPNSKDTIAKGKIGKLEFSRLMIGSNLIKKFAHARDLRYVSDLMGRYFTEEKIIETLAIAEAHGVDTIVISQFPETVKKYREKHGGKIKIISYGFAELEPGMQKFRENLKRLVDDYGISAAYIMNFGLGPKPDDRVKLMAEAIDVADDYGIPCGVGAHDLAVHRACEEKKVPAAFYVKTFHHLNYPSSKIDYDSVFCQDPEAVRAFMQNCEKPWIAFKVMAAGAIHPRDAFHYAVDAGADFVLAGMFDWQIEEDVRLFKHTLETAGKKRLRPWRA